MYLAALLVGAQGCAREDDAAAYDRAVRALAERVSGTPENTALADLVNARIARARAAPGELAAGMRERLDALQLEPLRIPGLFYRTHAWSGADLGRVEVWLGRPVTLVETGEVDTVERNAAAVRVAVRAAAQGGRRVVLFSASKGSADVQEALAGDPSLGRDVALWVDLVGLLEGTPLTDPGTSAAERAAIGLPEDTATSMSRAVRRAAPAADPRRFPAGTRAVHVAGFPARDAISNAARAGFERLRPLGPNDGYLMLESFLRVPGRVLVVPGVDHYLRTADLEPTVVALVSVLLDELALRAPRSAPSDGPPDTGSQ